MTPVVDDSDFELTDSSSSSAKGKAKDFDKLMQAADTFTDKYSRKKRNRKTKGGGELTLVEDAVAGISLDESLEDDVDMSKEMIERARTGKVDTSLQGRIQKWAGETQQFVTKPTNIQVTYATIFAASIAILFLLFLLTFVLGGVKQRGDSLAVFNRRQAELQDAKMQQFAIDQENWRRMASVKNIQDLADPDSIGLRTYDEVYYGILLPEYGGPQWSKEKFERENCKRGYCTEPQKPAEAQQAPQAPPPPADPAPAPAPEAALAPVSP